MTLREQFTAAMKEAMRAKDTARLSTVRMILAKLKDTDIAARPTAIVIGNPIREAPPQVGDEQIIGMLRGMVKSRRESVALYEQGNRPELAAKEQAEILVIEGFLPQAMDDAALAAAVDAAVAGTGAASLKEMGKVMAALKAAHGAALDMGRAGPLVRARLGAAGGG